MIAIIWPDLARHRFAPRPGQADRPDMHDDVHVQCTIPQPLPTADMRLPPLQI